MASMYNNGRNNGRGGGNGSNNGRNNGRGNNNHNGNADNRTCASALMSCLNKNDMNDNSLLRVLNPSIADREMRHELVGSSVVLPPKDVWRNSPSVGAEIQSFGKVLTNWFQIDYKTGMLLYQYNVQMFQFRSSTNEFSSVDVCSREDTRTLFKAMALLQKKNPELFANNNLAYNARSLIYTTSPLSFNDEFNDIVVFQKSDFSDSHFKLLIKLKLVKTITERDNEFTSALDIAITNFVKHDSLNENRKWLDSNNRIFSSNYEVYEHNNKLFQIQRGFHISLKQSQGGLCLTADITAQLFLAGGELINFLLLAGNFRNIEEFRNTCKSKNGLSKKLINNMEDSIKGFKIRQKYVTWSRKVKGMGSNSLTEAFLHEGNMITVAQYYEIAAKSDPALRLYLHNGKLKYPELPTINIGSNTRKILIPVELCLIPGGY